MPGWETRENARELFFPPAIFSPHLSYHCIFIHTVTEGQCKISPWLYVRGLSGYWGFFGVSFWCRFVFLSGFIRSLAPREVNVNLIDPQQRLHFSPPPVSCLISSISRHPSYPLGYCECARVCVEVLAPHSTAENHVLLGCSGGVCMCVCVWCI